MKQRSRPFIEVALVSLFCFSPLCFSSAQAKGLNQAQLKSKIESIIPSRKFPALEASIVIASLEKNEIIYSQNADKLMIPASVNKVLTAFTALKVLGPSASFKTQVYANQPIRDGVLMGDIFIKGGGDPSLVSERMWMMVNDLMRLGIKKISGNIVGDATYFDSETTPKSRPDYLTDQAYNAPVGALSFNFNTATIYVTPGAAAKTPPAVYVDPENSYIDVVNQASTGSSSSRESISVSRIEHVKGDLGDTVLLRGSIPSGSKEIRFYRNIVNPTLYAAHMFKEFLNRRQVEVGGTIKEGAVPSGAKLLLEFESLPMWHVVWGMNKFSNNFVADQIVKKLGAEKFGPPGTLDKGIATIQTEMEKLGMTKTSYTIVDGSGLTRKSRISAQNIYRVLYAAYKDFSLYPEFVASLGVAGTTGTMRRRFLSSSAEDLLRAKTGTLDGVAALAGYTPTIDGEMLAFVILLNDPAKKYGKMSNWVDQIALAARQFVRK